MKHINEMDKTGKMVIAGPFEKGGKQRGILTETPIFTFLIQ